MCESGESCAVEIDGKRLVRGAESVDPHIELSSPEEERIQQVSLTDIWLWWILFIEGLPLGDISDLVEDEDPSSLALRCLNDSSSTGFMIHKVLLSLWVFLNS